MIDHLPSTPMENPAQAWQKSFMVLLMDTYRQAHASAVLWIMLSVTLLGFLLCLSVSVQGFESAGPREEHPEWLPRNTAARYSANELMFYLGTPGSVFSALGYTQLRTSFFENEARRTGVQEAHGTLYLGFGMIEVPRSRDASDAVRNFQVLLATAMAGVMGMVLAIIWTAGFLPTFLEPSAASVLLVKPTPRWLLLLGKYLGVVLFFGVQVLLFVVLTWLALGWRTGVWDPAYLMTAPLMTLQFAIFYSFSVMLAVATRNTVACAFGTLLFFAACIAMNTARHSLVIHAGEPGYFAHVPMVVNAGYWFLPKPVDMNILLSSLLEAGNYFQQLFEMRTLLEKNAFQPVLSLVASCLFMVGSLWVAAAQFQEIDY